MSSDSTSDDESAVIDFASARERVRDRGRRRRLTIDQDSLRLGVTRDGGLVLTWDALVDGAWQRQRTPIAAEHAERLAQTVRIRQAKNFNESYYAAHPDERPVTQPRKAPSWRRCQLSRGLGLGGRCRRKILHDGPCRDRSGEWAKVCDHARTRTRVWVPREDGASLPLPLGHRLLPQPKTCPQCGAVVLSSTRSNRSRP